MNAWKTPSLASLAMASFTACFERPRNSWAVATVTMGRASTNLDQQKPLKP